VLVTTTLFGGWTRADSRSDSIRAVRDDASKPLLKRQRRR
jgi:hypothetical protein